MLTLTLAIGMVFNAAEAVDQISLSTSNDIYYDGDYVVIFGTVNTIFENMPITIQIYHNSNLVDVAQVTVAQDGTFVKSFNAVGQQWSEEGTYIIRVQYTPTQIGETTFEFFSQVIDKSSAVYPVQIPNSGTFDVGYTIRGGDVTVIDMNQDRYSLLIKTTMNANGNLGQTSNQSSVPPAPSRLAANSFRDSCSISSRYDRTCSTGLFSSPR